MAGSSTGLVSVRIEAFSARDGFLDSEGPAMKLGLAGEVLE
jgi:hypothetical protein